MASFLYGRGALRLIIANAQTNPIDWLNEVMKCGLSTSTHVPDKDDTFFDDVGADDFIDGELSGTGYAAGWGGGRVAKRSGRPRRWLTMRRMTGSSSMAPM